MMKLSKTDQYRCVSAGFALGLIMNSHRQIPGSKPEIEFDFTSAWRSWSHRHALPAADKNIAGPGKDWDVIRILTDLDEDKRKPYVPFHWDEHSKGGPLVVIRDAVDFNPTDHDDVEFYARNIHDDIPASAWQELAATFLAKLDKQ